MLVVNHQKLNLLINKKEQQVWEDTVKNVESKNLCDGFRKMFFVKYLHKIILVSKLSFLLRFISLTIVKGVIEKDHGNSMCKKTEPLT